MQRTLLKILALHARQCGANAVVNYHLYMHVYVVSFYLDSLFKLQRQRGSDETIVMALQVVQVTLATMVLDFHERFCFH